MRHVQNGAVEAFEEVQELLFEAGPQVAVERRERLIQHQNRRLSRKHPSESHPLLLSPGELRRVLLAEPVQVEEVEKHTHVVVALLTGGRAVHAALDVLGHRHVGEQLVVLEEERRAALLRSEVDLGRRVEERDAVHDDAPGIRRLHAGDTPERHALAASRRAEETDRLIRGVESDLQVERREVLLDVDGERHSTASPLR